MDRQKGTCGYRRIVLVCIGVILSLGVACAEEDIKLLGAGLMTYSRPYTDVGSRSMAVPILVWNYNNFYVQGAEAGYYFYKKDMVSLAFLAAPRFMGYHSSESDALQGMEDRNMSLDAGWKAELGWPWSGASFSVKVVGDTLSRSGGQEAELSFAQEIKGEIWRLKPTVGLRAQSSRMTNYYYGIRTEEAKAGRPEYSPGLGVNYFGDVLFSIGVAKNWIMILRGGVEYLDDEVRNSPIVEKKSLFSGVVGVARRF